MAWYDDYIVRIPGIQGGFPTIRGTRTPVRSIVVLYCQTYPGNIEDVARALSHLTPTEIEAALAYYRDHKDLVDADIDRQRHALERLLATR